MSDAYDPSDTVDVDMPGWLEDLAIERQEREHIDGVDRPAMTLDDMRAEKRKHMAAQDWPLIHSRRDWTVDGDWRDAS